jgi:hypothetical protein
MSPSDTNAWLHLLPWVGGLQSLKVRLPHVGAAASKSARETFWRRMGRMTQLRELWFADGLGDWDADAPGRRAPSPRPTSFQLRCFTATLASRCPALVYLRVLDRAWRIERPAEEGAKPVLRALSDWQVKNNVPDAFRWEVPSVV